MSMDPVLERVAAIVHEWWADWATGLLRQEQLSAARQERWRSFLVPYAELPERVKEWDQFWARKVLAVIAAEPAANAPSPGSKPRSRRCRIVEGSRTTRDRPGRTT
jgi:hypothetical protein